MDRSWRFCIDRGGTFTDVIGQASDGAETSLKLLSASPAYSDAAVEAMRRILRVGPGEAFPADRVRWERDDRALKARSRLIELFRAEQLVTFTHQRVCGSLAHLNEIPCLLCSAR